MTRLSFAKMHGCGNDFVVVDGRDAAAADWGERDWSRFARSALDRRFGVGGDQLLVVQPSREADFFMGIRNVDGSSAQMCANGIRAFVLFLRRRELCRDDELRVETLGGVVTPRWLGDGQVEVRMPRPILEPQKIPTTLPGPAPVADAPLEIDGETFAVTAVSMGNPHCVIFVDDPEAAPVERLGPRIEHCDAFPERVNVEFVAVRGRSELVQRTWERGTGETLACGSGACASAVAAALTGRADREVTVHLRGGDLEIRWPDPGGPVWLTGPAAHVFDGEIEI